MNSAIPKKYTCNIFLSIYIYIYSIHMSETFNLLQYHWMATSQQEFRVVCLQSSKMKQRREDGAIRPEFRLIFTDFGNLISEPYNLGISKCWLSNPRFVYIYIIYIYIWYVFYIHMYIFTTIKLTKWQWATWALHPGTCGQRTIEALEKKNTRTAWFIVDFHGSLGDVSRISWISQRCFFMVHDIHHFFMNPLLIWSVHVWSLLERKTRYIVWSQHETKKTRKRQLSILVSMFHALKPKND